MRGFFITGTDTGIGKTWFTCWLVRAWRAVGQNAIGLKPIASGDREDGRLLREASGNCLSLDEINPVYLREPAAPLVAARAENRVIDFDFLNHSIQEHGARFSPIAIEGAGGWRVPLAPNYEVREWARDLGLPVVVVALNRLGAVNHTLLTVESIEAAGLTCAGVVLNPGPETRSSEFEFAQSSNAALLREMLSLPVLELNPASTVPEWLGGKP